MAVTDLLQQLGYDRSPRFLRTGDAALETAPAYGHVFRRAKAETGLLGVYTLRSSKATTNTPAIPTVYLCWAETEAQADETHRLVWNQDVVPFLIVETPRGFRLYSGFDYRRHAKNLLREFNSVSELVQSGFHAEAIDDGTLWRSWGRAVRPESRVDWRLLGNLKTLDRWLQKHGLEPEVSHALIGKYVYLYYLRHRKILSDRKLEAWSIPEGAVFGRSATVAGVEAITERLEGWLNGRVFPLEFGRPGAPTDDHVAHVAATFAGDQPGKDDHWQLHLDFQAYDFSYIPIETLSVVYEQFLHAPTTGTRSRGREAGAYYTPIPVVNFMLAEMEDRRPMEHGMRVLDPSCGSGAFLVQCYRRLIEKKYPATGPQPRPVQLRDLMQRSIFGVDRDGDACSVSELSLVMTLLDYCDPPDLEDGTRFKLPLLRGLNIIKGNFFSEEPSCWELLGRRRFDWVVGNPPWKRLNANDLSLDDKPVWKWLQESRQHDTPVGSNQVAQAFTWEIGRFLSESGYAGLLLPASTLFDEFSIDFRRTFFRQFRVSSVANFSNLAEVLFSGRSRVPAAALFFSKRARPPDMADGEHVSTYSPLVANQEPTRPVAENKRNETWGLVLNASEIRAVPLAEVLTGSALPWKLASWGSHLDRRLLERITAKFNTFRDLEVAKRLVLSEGPQLRMCPGLGLEFCEEVVGKQVLDMEALARLRTIFEFPQRALNENTNLYLRLRGGRRGLTVCRPPHVIVSAARNFAVYTSEYLIVPPRQVGITSPRDDELLLKAVALYLNSDFAFYHQFLTSSELGVKRPRASLEALRAMPTPLAELSRSSLEAWAALHDRLARATAGQITMNADSGPTLFNLTPAPLAPAENMKQLIEDLNHVVSDALGFRSRERALVEDLVQIRLQLDDGKLGRPAVDPPSTAHLKRYAVRLKAELDSFVGDSLSKRYGVNIVFDAHTGMIQLMLLKFDQPNDPKVYAADDEMAVELEKMRQRLRRKYAQWVYFDRNLQIFDGRYMLFFKPMQRFHWTESQAMFDAAEVISRTLAYQGGNPLIDPSLQDHEEIHQEGSLAEDAADIRRAFVNRVHQVLQEGYKRLDAASHVSTPEPAITGRLVEAMEDFLKDMTAPEWADYFSVHDDPPVNDGKKFGKDRNRIDIKVRASVPRPGTNFSFEAKRLARGYAVSRYLGRAGLGCILCGDYAHEDDEAGMIGYVQDDDARYWAGKIEETIKTDPAAHEASGTDCWKPHAFPTGPSHVFVSVHARKAVGRAVTIYHSLLIFTAD